MFWCVWKQNLSLLLPKSGIKGWDPSIPESKCNLTLNPCYPWVEFISGPMVFHIYILERNSSPGLCWNPGSTPGVMTVSWLICCSLSCWDEAPGPKSCQIFGQFAAHHGREGAIWLSTGAISLAICWATLKHFILRQTAFGFASAYVLGVGSFSFAARCFVCSSWTLWLFLCPTETSDVRGWKQV